MVVDLHVCMSDNAFMPLDDVSASEAFIGRNVIALCGLKDH